MHWHLTITALLGIVAFGWLAVAGEIALGVPRIPWLKDVSPLNDSACPSLSILFAGRDEAEKIGVAVQSFLGVDYPRLEVIAVNDRSADATQEILEAAAAKDARLKVVNVMELPPGWLGKTHALQRAFEQSSGEWLVFTDADVTFAPDVLRRAVALALQHGWDHVPLLAHAETYTIGERISMPFFGLGFVIGTKPWKKNRAGSHFYLGVGAFQLVRRSAYIAMGEHKRLAMEVVDDIKLGKLMQNAGFQTGTARAGRAVSVHWHSGVGNIIRGTTKNFFAAAQYRLDVVALQLTGFLAFCVLPWIAIFFVHGWARVFAAIAVAIAAIANTGTALAFEVSPVYGLTEPIGALIMVWMLTRSTFVTLRDGGITWRGTFYRLEDLKRGSV